MWMAAHRDVQAITAAQIFELKSVNISELFEKIEDGDDIDNLLPLRVSSVLLVGISRMFSQKVRVMLQESAEVYAKLTISSPNADMPAPTCRNARNKATTERGLSQQAYAAGVDLDLELSLPVSDSEGFDMTLTHRRPSCRKITFPDDIVANATDYGQLWEDALDPLFLGNTLEEPVNPLDIDYCDIDGEHILGHSEIACDSFPVSSRRESPGAEFKTEVEFETSASAARSMSPISNSSDS